MSGEKDAVSLSPVIIVKKVGKIVVAYPKYHSELRETGSTLAEAVKKLVVSQYGFKIQDRTKTVAEPTRKPSK